MSLPDWQVERLLHAFLKRKQFEAKIMIGVVGEAFNSKGPEASLGGLATMGFGIRDAK